MRMVRLGAEGMCVKWALFVCLLATLPARSLLVPLEAAFQGRCDDGNPCDQTCFNLHDNMYECDCTEGFYLNSNGYNCIKFNSTGVVAAGSVGPTQSSIAIQIEVDIEPPVGEEELSSSELARLGLPSHHVHYRAGQPAGTELLAPEDIQVSYTVKDEVQGAGEDRPEAGGPHHPRLHHPELPAAQEDIDPPRALPALEEVAQRQHGEHDDVVDQQHVDDGREAVVAEVEPINQSLQDNIYHVPAFCGLDCGPGRCHMERAAARWMPRCLCSAGWGGDRCAEQMDISTPLLTGGGYLALPTLQNAYSDLHLALEFKPTSWTGLLLLTGETDDMSGDYLALVIKDGYLELRLDCGTGPGVVKTSAQVHLNTWNHLSVFRHDWGVWVQLNGGKKEEGRSQGLFSRITFNQPVYVGGPGHIKHARSFLGVDNGFQGCVRRLEINNKVYNFNATSAGGDTIGGIDVGRCGAPGCSKSSCGRGQCGEEGATASPCGRGQCLKEGGCSCPLGTTGDNCQIDTKIQMPRFTGSSHLRHVGLGDAALIWLEMEVVFKPSHEQGLILYNGNRNDGKGDFLALFLNQGFVEFAFDLGNGISSTRSVGVVSVGSWHTVSVSRTGREVYLSLDGVEVPLLTSEGGFSQLSLSQNLWLGGVPEYGLLSPYLPITKPFLGCIQKVVVNGLPLDLVDSAISGVNVENCEHSCQDSPCGSGRCTPALDSFSCQCPAGWEGASCSFPSTSAPPIPGFSGNSYLYFNNADIYQNLVGVANSINIRLRVTGGHGVLLWVGGAEEDPSPDYLLLGVDRGYLQFWFNVGGGEMVLEYNATRIDDGLWHRVRATRMEQTASLMVDNGAVITGTAPGQLRQLNANNGLYIGGVEGEPSIVSSKYHSGLTGCVAELSVGSMVNINLLHSAERGNNIDACSTP